MSEETTTIELDKELKTIADQLSGLTLMQASQLVKFLEDEWGVSAAAPAAAAAAPPAAAEAEVEARKGDKAAARRARAAEARAARAESKLR